MLQKFRQSAARCELVPLSTLIFILNGDVECAFDLYQNFRKRKTIVPQEHLLLAPLDDFWIDQRALLVIRRSGKDVDEDDLFADADLWRGDPSTKAVRLFEVS